MAKSSKTTKKTTQSKASNIIQVGTDFRVYSDSVKVHTELPVQTYRVGFHPMQGHWLEAIEPMTPSPEKMYGNYASRIERIVKGYAAMNRSYGVLMSGSGGMGKTMLMRALTHRVGVEFDMPIVVVDSYSPGLARFIDSLGECVVMFDEFEKVFTPSTENSDDDDQVQFLSLFDGMSSTKRMYIVTVNDLYKVNSYMINRTGRFHAHLRFDFPDADAIREYLSDAGVKPKQIAKVVAFAARVPLNYDHLRSIAFELVQVGGDFTEIITDLNIKQVNALTYQITAVFENDKFQVISRLDMFGDETTYAQFHIDHDYHVARFNPSDVTEMADGSMLIEADAVKFELQDLSNKTRKRLGEFRGLMIAPSREKSIGFAL